MSIFTSHHTKVLAIPNDPGHTVTIRMLPGAALDAAARANQIQSIEALKAMGGAAFMRELQAIGGTDVVKEAVAADPLLQDDRVVLMEKGVLDWTYDKPRDHETFADIASETADFIAREILRLSKPKLFLPEETAAPTRGADAADASKD